MPNVIRSNDGRTSIKGAREDQAAILVNGSLSNDPATGRFQVEIPLEALQRAEIFTNPYLPEYGKFTSGVKRLETKPGGQQWKYSLYDFFPSVRARYGKIFGLANVSPPRHHHGSTHPRPGVSGPGARRHCGQSHRARTGQPGQRNPQVCRAEFQPVRCHSVAPPEPDRDGQSGLAAAAQC